MSDNVTNEIQFAPFDPDEVVDWTAEYEAIMQEPWLHDIEPMVDGFDWDGRGPGQGTAGVLPGESAKGGQRSGTNNQGMKDTPLTQNEAILHHDKPLILCDVEGCNAGPFGRKAELQRHKQQKHTKPRFPCTAIGCNRTGERAFARKDKLKDHILAGHDDNTNFRCPSSECHKILTRDLMALHVWDDASWWAVQAVRRCPIPKCPFQINLIGRKSQMDELMIHLHEHGADSRMKYKSTLRERGYDAASGHLICPICSSHAARFEKHADFYKHTIEHLGIPDLVGVKYSGFYDGYYPWRLERQIRHTDVRPEIREHRRVLLSLWPGSSWFPIWDDVKYCEKRANILLSSV